MLSEKTRTISSDSTIPRISVSELNLFNHYYTQEKPVIVCNIPHKRDGIIESTLRLISSKDSSSEEVLWYNTQPEYVREFAQLPQPINAYFEGDESFLRNEYVRIWYSQANHITPWHYDGNSLHVFNLQLKGSKRWKIVSPSSPIRCIPFTRIAIPQEVNCSEPNHFKFILNEGEMLFLPRYWFHEVESLSSENVNINWCLTPKYIAPNTSNSNREKELIVIKKQFYWLLSPGAKQKIDTYGGVGMPALDIYCRDINYLSAIVRILSESLNIFWLLLSYKRLLKIVKTITSYKNTIHSKIIEFTG